MSESTFEITAIRYGHHHRNAAANFIGGDEHDGPMPLDYYIWAIKGPTKTYLLDTGFGYALYSAQPQFQVGIDGVLDQHRYPGAA